CMRGERRPIPSGGLQMVNVVWDGMINNKRKAPDRDLLVYDYTPTADIEFPWKAQPGLAAGSMWRGRHITHKDMRREGIGVRGGWVKGRAARRRCLEAPADQLGTAVLSVHTTSVLARHPLPRSSHAKLRPSVAA
ncbi:hypothetical protein KUCAC02_017362, partial [Chaenocephalus aceratus]